ncbi:Fanconi anemia group I protein [Rhynchospora pubera]|uniref:Fanconi anemia group I protein n=1 Tax=Rhynchospora pubera TaxID=906938 RepID=A0AAV8D723_9POAL|nr:Fanconi anemia group I protein [Rhynchospora pubera]
MSTTITADEIISLARDPSSTLPSPLPLSSLLSLLSSSPSPLLLSSLLSLLSRSPPPFPSSLIHPSLLSLLSPSFPSSHLPQITPLFPPLLSRLDPSLLPSLLDLLTSHLFFISDPNTASLLDLLPPLLSLSISNYGFPTVAQFLDRILSSDWSKSFLLKFASILHELAPDVGPSVPDFLDKIFNGMSLVDIQDMPSLVYQLLLLASKGNCRRTVIGGIFRFFGEHVRGPGSIVRQVEGTVLMHVNFAVKQDLTLGQEIVATVRSDLGSLNHFMVNVLLSVARVKRFSDSVMSALKTAVVDSNRDCKVSRDCKWLPNCLKEQCLETAKCVEQAIMKAVSESNGGREHVVPGFVQLGFLLLESGDSGLNGEDNPNNGIMGIQELGIQMLKSLFEIHEIARTEVMQQCKYRILSMKPQQSILVIRLLGCLIQSYRYTILEYVSYLKELLDYFAYMHQRTATALINCMLSLVRSNRELQDYIILVVRKAMFKREESVRVAATKAIVDLILIQSGFCKSYPSRILDSSSQASSSQQIEVNSGLSKRLFDDLSGLLRRCLSQQVKVKEVLYDGLVRIVSSDPSIASSIFDFLWPHFVLFYAEDSDCPLRIDACFKVENGKVHVVEPLDHLLSCISQINAIQQQIKSDLQHGNSWPCFSLSGPQDGEVHKSSSGDAFSTAMSKIRKFLGSCATEEKQVQSQETANSVPAEMVSLRRLSFVSFIEVVINMILSELAKSGNQEKASLEKELFELVESYNFFDKKIAPSKKTRGHFFTVSSLLVLLQVSVRLCTTSVPAKTTQDRTQNHTQPSSSNLVDYPKIVPFALDACLRHLQSVNSSKEVLVEDLKQLCVPISQLALLLVPGLKKEAGPKKKIVKCKGDQLCVALTCLKEILKKNLPKDMLMDLIVEMISAMLGKETGIEEPINDLEDRFVDLIGLFLEREIKPMFSHLIGLSLNAESEALAELILIIGKSLPAEQRSSLSSWVIELYKTKKIENANSVCTMATIAINLIPAPKDVMFAKDVAAELLLVFGSESDDPIPASERFSFVNCTTKDAIAGVLLGGVESSIIEFDWIASRLKEMIGLNSGSTAFDEKGSRHIGGTMVSRIEVEDALYSRLISVVHLLSYFAEMNLSDSQSARFLKLNVRFYRLLARISKLQIAPKGCKQSFPGLKFQKLAEETCKLLTCRLYKFISLVQYKLEQTAPAKGTLNKIKRDSRCIPDLIFQIEDYEKYLIKLTKLTRVNLMRHAKRSTSRDFMIKAQKVEDPDEKHSHEEDNHDHVAENDASSENESDKCEGIDEESAPDNVLIGEPGYSGSEKEDDEEVLARKKRAKISDVVEDSDEEV